MGGSRPAILSVPMARRCLPNGRCGMPEPIVFLPGLQSDHRSWVNQLRHFEGKRETLVPSGFHSCESLAAMAAVIEPQLPERFHLVPWSMGGYLAFEMLPRIAERIVSMVLIATSARADTSQSTQQRYEQIAIAEAHGIRVANRNSLAASCLDQSLLNTEAFRAVNDAAVEIGLAAYRAQQAAIIGRRDATDRLGLVRCPTLVVVGETDTTTPPSEARAIHAGIAGSILEILPGCGHCPPMEKPTRINQLIERWAARADSMQPV